MTIYGYIRPYVASYVDIAKYCHMHVNICIWDVWAYIVDVWICIFDAWTFIFSVWTCMFGVWTCICAAWTGILDVWTCICVSGLIFWLLYTCIYLKGAWVLVGCDYGVCTPTRRGLCACHKHFLFLKKHAPGIWSMYFVDFQSASIYAPR